MTANKADETRLRSFARYIADAARAAGYDIDSPRGGGKTNLARDAGLSLSTISRLLTAERMPDATAFEPLAKALRVPLRELLIRSGIVSEESLTHVSGNALRSRPITPREAAEDLGIRDPEDVALFESMVKRLRRHQAGSRDNAPGGEAAEA